MTFINLGILAHVDAGKTTLTERLLHAAGVIDEIGRVDHGTTQTDSLALERQRGITIKSAVVSFVIDGVTVNLIDTPGHSDFIAEVERVLGVLDGAVLVVSAVEGVQSQTLVLHRALRRLGIPTILFVNKIDRRGADVDRTVAMIEQRLDTPTIAMVRAHRVGSSDAQVLPLADVDRPSNDPFIERLAEFDDEILRRYLDGDSIAPSDQRAALRTLIAAHEVQPVYVGSAMTGAGVTDLMTGVTTALPVSTGDPRAEPTGTVFKITRDPHDEKVALVRMFAGTLAVRDRVRLAELREERVTSIQVFDRGATSSRVSTVAGEIAEVHGWSGARIGDRFGAAGGRDDHQPFAPPTLETAVVARDPLDRPTLFSALTELAEQDPLINLRQDDVRHDLFLSLFGEVQREVVAQTLAADYGIAVEFRPVTPICIERPRGPASAIETIPRHRSPQRPFLATVGVSVAPLPAGSGVTFDLAVPVGSIPMHVFDTVDAFRGAMDRIVRDTLRQGLHGWEVTDCAVTMTDSGYQAPPRRWPGTTLSDFRLLTPLVLLEALRRASTAVCEPMLAVRLEFPADTLGAILAALSDAEGTPGAVEIGDRVSTLDATVRAARLHDLQSRVPDLTRGEGLLESSFAEYRPVAGTPPSRPRTDRNPLDRADYLRRLKGLDVTSDR